MVEQTQLELCARFGVKPFKPFENLKAGVALATLTQTPIHGLREHPTTSTNGWYIWAGEFSDAPDFFDPLHAHHLHERCPDVMPYLALPPGYRFLIATGHEDVWFDPSLLRGV